jgi:peptide/nickel transport system substrate-binding protein
MKALVRLALVVCLCAANLVASAPAPAPLNQGEELARVEGSTGRYGGHLVVGQRSEPKTLNPATATDAISREVLGRLHSDLIEINRATQKTEPGLAKSWETSSDGRTFTLHLRKGIRFSDGQPFDADDVIFSFTVYLDEAINSPQRDLLIIDDKTPTIKKLDPYTVQFSLPRPYAAAERLFDGFPILPRHILEKPYHDGKFVQAWPVNTPPAELVGLGPFRVKQYWPGQRIVLERNPYYWKADHDNRRLPYLDELVFLFVGSEDAQVMRFEAGETDLINRLSAENYALLSREQLQHRSQLSDLGPSLEYNFLVFNQNDLSGKKLDQVSRKQAWFQDLKFRQAVSAAVDRDSIVKLVYGSRGTPLWGNVGPGNKAWVNASLPHPQRSVEVARELLKSAGFTSNASGQLLDRAGQTVEFSLVTSSSNAQRMKMATLLQDDLSQIGMKVNVVPLDFRALIDRVFQSFDYEAAIMGLGGADADPNPELNVWLSNGSSHLWHLNEAQPATAWEREIDQLMNEQMVTLDYHKRKKLYDRVQQIVSEQVPFIFLATPNILTGAKSEIGNFQPALLDHYTLWNADQLYLRNAESAGAR